MLSNHLFERKHLLMKEILLASSSPRRKQLLSDLGIPTRSIAPHIEELQAPDEPPDRFACRMAAEKAHAVLKLIKSGRNYANSGIIIAGDTIVVQDQSILGKPIDAEHACAMLQSLSNRYHQVITGMSFLEYCDMQLCYEHTFSVQTRVCFKALSPTEIQRYVASGDPLDKAGAYGIQSGAAYMIKEIHGSYTNVVGLPLAETVEILQQRGFTPN